MRPVPKGRSTGRLRTAALIGHRRARHAAGLRAQARTVKVRHILIQHLTLAVA